MSVLIQAVNKENVQEILKLRVGENQQSYIEAAEQSLADAKECSYYKPVGLYWEGGLVGFAMYGFFPLEGEGGAGRVWLDRFIIDERYQGQGLGKRMLEALLLQLEDEYHCEEIYLSLYADNQRALQLYKRYGFEFNGELDINGEKVMVRNMSIR